MKGDVTVKKRLNEVLTNELTAINQYFIHAKMFQHWGLARLGILKAGIADCETCGDYVSRSLLREILESEEEHIDWLETQLDLIGKVGIENFQQSQMGTES